MKFEKIYGKFAQIIISNWVTQFYKSHFILVCLVDSDCSNTNQKCDGATSTASGTCICKDGFVFDSYTMENCVAKESKFTSSWLLRYRGI